MSETPLYNSFIRQQKTIIKKYGENSKRDKEFFFLFVDKLKEKYPLCYINFNIKERNNKTIKLKSNLFRNNPKMYYELFEATEKRCSQNGGKRNTRKRRRE